MIIIMLMMEMAAPKEKPVYATFNVKAINDTILEIQDTGGSPLPRSTISVSVNGFDYRDAGLRDTNCNGFWDQGEVLYIEGLNFSNKLALTIVSRDTVLLSMDLPSPPFIYVAPVVTVVPTAIPNFTLPTPPPPLPPLPCPTPVVTPAPATFAGGMIATYYNNTDWTDSLVTITVPEIRFTNLEATTNVPYPSTDEVGWPMMEVGRNTSFSVCFEGYIRIITDDAYTFYLRSDDGSFMQLDGQTIIDNGGIHEDREETWTGTLTTGYHPVKVFMFQYDSRAIIHLLYTSSGTPTKWFVTDVWH